METIKYMPRYIRGYYCVVRLIDGVMKLDSICSSKEEAERKCAKLNGYEVISNENCNN